MFEKEIAWALLKRNH